MNLSRTITTLLVAAWVQLCHAQVLPEFNMSDTVVTICKGILLDSEAGPGGNIYGNNEDFVFTIDAGSTITLVFQPPFCLEQGYDFITFHDGPSIASPQIGPAYTGTSLPPPIVAYSGALTVHFTSDANVAYCGFQAQWTSVVEPPVPPVMSIPQPPSCNSSTLAVQFSGPIACDSILPGAFSIQGTGASTVVGATPVNCVGGETQSLLLQVDPPFERNCPYQVSFTLGIRDRCDSLWYFTLNAATQVVSCPIGVVIDASRDTICAGDCITLLADVNGCLSYTYAWSNGLPPMAGPITVCPSMTTTYSVQVAEQGTNNQATATRTIVVLDPQVVNAPVTVCQSLDAFALLGTPPGGWWSGPGIIDSLAGTFDPDTAGPGTHVLAYGIPGGCMATVTLHVDSMDAGMDEAACPGTAPFQVSGYSPQGGTWSGPYMQPNGSFDPSTVGQWVVTYTAGNCSDTKTIHVDVITGQTLLDTVCQSEVPFNIPVMPFGGRWNGPGIVDSIYGTFDPDEAGGGTHVLNYVLHGCDEQFTIHVKPVDIGRDRSACPAQAPHLLTPAAIPPGGTWAGGGITDPTSGLYDPVQAGNGWDVITYAAPNGCVDTIGILVGWTQVNHDTLTFCSDGDALILNAATTGRTPWDGSWSGAGIVQNGDGDWFFHPQNAGVGVHMLTYSANTCSDTLVAVVHPASLGVPSVTVCSANTPFQVASVPPGALFSGPGVSASGLFDPAQAGAGQHIIRYDSPAGCHDEVIITVILFQQAVIAGVANTYCGNALQVDVQLDPPGGVFSGTVGTSFVPASLPPGPHQLVYTVGNGACSSSDTVTFVNHPALATQVLVGNNPICSGGGSSVEVITSGGAPGALITHQWSDGLFPAAVLSLSPTSTHTYTVTTNDGCSDTVVDSITIVVHPPFMVSFAYSGMQCYGEPGFVEGAVSGSGTYTFHWGSTPAQTGDQVALPAGTIVPVQVVNDQTGCTRDTLVQVPSWPAITAQFSPNPNMDCVPWDQRLITFIDLSLNAVGGYWVIDGQVVPYSAGGDPTHDAGRPGHYDVRLVVWNAGGCVDSTEARICIRDSEAIFIPDAFSPNGDGVNDVLYVRGPSIATMIFHVYDRWGTTVFESRRTDHGWDGRTDGRPAASGVYLWTLRATTAEGDALERTGNITLVR